MAATGSPAGSPALGRDEPSPRRATLVATLTEIPAGVPATLSALPGEVEVLEVRADLVGDLEAAQLRESFAGRLLYTLRSTAEGGGHGGAAEERARRLAQAAQSYDLVDLEGQRDTASELLERVPAERRILSWHGPPTAVEELRERFDELARTPAHIYKLIPAAERSGHELAPLELLRSLRRDDVVAFAAGDHGVWTRLLAPHLGAPWVYGAASAVPGAPGQPTIERLVLDFGLPWLPPVEALFGILGNPVSHSLSPRLHNRAYRELGIAALYLPFHAESFGGFWLEVAESAFFEAVGVPLAGFSVTAPHKAAALAVAGAASPLAEHVGAANTLIFHDGVWEAETTDPDGVVLPLRRFEISFQDLPAVVVGAGGAGRAAAAGLAYAGAQAILSNRSRPRGEVAARELGLPFVALDDLDVGAFDVLVNATSLGHRDEDPLPFAVEELSEGAVVVDMVYGPRTTPLVAACRARGLRAVDGREVLLAQALAQFRLMTGREMPLEVGREALGLDSGSRAAAAPPSDVSGKESA